MSQDEQRRSNLIRRLRTAIEQNELALSAARAGRNRQEIRRLREDLENRRAYLAELLAQRSQVP